MLVVLTLSAAGCPGDDGGGAGGSSETTAGEDSTGPGPQPSTSGVTLDATTSGATVSDTADSTGTTGEVVYGHGRFVVRERLMGNTLTTLQLVAYADGEIAPLVEVSTGLAEGETVSGFTTLDEGRILAYCTAGLGPGVRPCKVVDMTVDPPGAPQDLDVAPVAPDSLLTNPEWIDATSSLIFAARSAVAPGPSGIYLAAYAGGLVATPVAVATTDASSEISEAFTVSTDGSEVGYTRRTTGAPSSAWIASASSPDPMSAVQVSDLVDPSLHAGAPRFVPGLDAVVYMVDDEEPTNPLAVSLWFVDTTAPAPGVPVRIDDPLAAPLRIRQTQIAPDGHALTYYLGATGELYGEVMYVDLASGTPAAPVEISTLSDDAALITRREWSPDSRWIAYQGIHDAPDREAVYLVDTSSGTPAAPVLASPGLVDGGNVQAWRFDDDGHDLYLVGQIGAELPALFRVDVSGATPGAPQPLSGAEGWVDEEILPSHDWTHVMHSAIGDARQLANVDVSTDPPGRPFLVNAPLPDGVDVAYGARFSADDSVVVYRESGATDLVRIADLRSGDFASLELDASGVATVADLP